MVFPGMPLGGGDVAQAAVAVLDVVPVHEVLSPLAGFVQAGEAARREFGAVLRRFEERFDEGVVVGHPGARTDRKFNRMRPSMARVLGLETRSAKEG